MSLLKLLEANRANRPQKVRPDEVHTVVTLREMELAFRDYVRLRKIQFCGPLAHKQPYKDHFERKIAYFEGRFPAFKPAYEKELAR